MNRMVPEELQTTRRAEAMGRIRRVQMLGWTQAVAEPQTIRGKQTTAQARTAEAPQKTGASQATGRARTQRVSRFPTRWMPREGTCC